MRPARSRLWQVGDRFRLNRWSETGGEGCVFVITRRTPQAIYFRSPEYDLPTDRARRIPRQEFYRQVGRRELIRVED